MESLVTRVDANLSVAIVCLSSEPLDVNVEENEECPLVVSDNERLIRVQLQREREKKERERERKGERERKKEREREQRKNVNGELVTTINTEQTNKLLDSAHNIYQLVTHHQQLLCHHSTILF